MSDVWKWINYNYYYLDSKLLTSLIICQNLVWRLTASPPAVDKENGNSKEKLLKQVTVRKDSTDSKKSKKER